MKIRILLIFTIFQVGYCEVIENVLENITYHLSASRSIGRQNAFYTLTDNLQYHLLKKYIHFYIYTRRNPQDYVEIYLDDSSYTVNMENEVLNPNNNVKMLTHGYQSSGSAEFIINMKNSYLQVADFNIIVVNWQDLAEDPIYPLPAYQTRFVGQKCINFIRALVNQYQMTLNQFHLIGHSLGAQIFGFTGRYMTLGKIGRVTGLDPARPLFEGAPTLFENMNVNDAQFVDIIHTAAGIVGILDPAGHVDFYPNGGVPYMPGCENPEIIDNLGCTHARSHEYFLESIMYPTGFLAHLCENANDARAGNCSVQPTNNDIVYETYMGDFVSLFARGIFYLTTNAESPYHQNLEK